MNCFVFEAPTGEASCQDDSILCRSDVQQEAPKLRIPVETMYVLVSEHISQVFREPLFAPVEIKFGHFTFLQTLHMLHSIDICSTSSP